MSYQLPRDVELRDGTTVSFRVLHRGDRAALKAFFESLPPHDRYYLREDVLDGDIIQGWLTHLNYLEVFPILALDEHDAVIADATLHREKYGARSHVGELRLAVRPDWRNRGLGTALVMQVLDEAMRAGLELLTVEVVAIEERAAAQALERINFQETARLPNFAKTERGEPRDIVIYSTEVAPILPAY